MVAAGAGGGVHDELAQLKALKEKKVDFESSCKDVDNVEKKTQRFCLPPPDKCSLCTKNVYRAEQFQCFGLLYHVNCFRCIDCKQALRVEKAHRCQKTGDLYCRVHFKLMEENQNRKMLTVEKNNNNEMVEEVSEI